MNEFCDCVLAMLKTRGSVGNKRRKNLCLQGAYVLGRETENKHIQKVGTGLLLIPVLRSAKTGEINQWWEVEVRVLLTVRVHSVWRGDDHRSESGLVKCWRRRVS